MFRDVPLLQSFANTLCVTVVGVVVQVLIGAMAAYGMIMRATRFNRVLGLILVLGFVVPAQSTLIPVYRMLVGVELVDSLNGLVVVYAGGAIFCYFLIQGYLRTLPFDVVEAAMLDGAGVFAIFWRIVLPLIRPIIVTVAVFQTMWVWNDFLIPNVVHLVARQAHHRAAGLHGGRGVHDELAGVHDAQRHRAPADGRLLRVHPAAHRQRSPRREHQGMSGAPTGTSTGRSTGTVPAPLFTDPLLHAPTDPVVVEAPDGTWRMLYTQRRAGDRSPGWAWVHGTDIGVAASDDGGRTWTYTGVVEGLDHLPGRNTLWAPEVVRVDGEYHLFLSHVPGVHATWDGTRSITHHTSADLVTWTYRGALPLSSDRVIDACVHPLPRGGHRLWYKDEARGSQQWCVDSPDLVTWSPPRSVITDPPGEGANVFRLGGWYWLIMDEWRGQGVYRSRDLESWERDGLVLGQPGSRPWDAGTGRHADAVVGTTAGGEEVGWIFYFTHRVEPGPDNTLPEPGPDADGVPLAHRTDVQVAQARVVDGHLVCDRDAAVDLDLRRARDARRRLEDAAVPAHVAGA